MNYLFLKFFYLLLTGTFKNCTTNFALFQTERVCNFKCDENGKFSKRVQNTLRKGGNCSLKAISPLSTVFSKDCRHIKIRDCLGKGHGKSFLKTL